MKEPPPSTEPASPPAAADLDLDLPMPKLMARAGLGGALMGMANLVPGISGGTMLLAAGIFPQFVEAVADFTRFRFRRRSLAVLAAVVIAAIIVIGPLAGIIGRLVVEHTWVMYSLFIGLTLGGSPLIWRMVGSKTASFWTSTIVGLAIMSGIAALQMQGAGTQGGSEAGFILLFLAGIAGASAMVLPGVSGGYLLLLMGAYITVLNGIEALYQAIFSFDLTAALEPGLAVVLPVGLGVVVGVVGVSNLIKLVLERWQRPSLGVLLGLLLGAVFGLWPFQQSVEPAIGSTLKGQIILEIEGEFVFQETGSVVEFQDYPRDFFVPSIAQAAGALGMIFVGFGVTSAVARFGDGRRS